MMFVRLVCSVCVVGVLIWRLPGCEREQPPAPEGAPGALGQAGEADRESPAPSQGAPASEGAQPGYATGRVTMERGEPLRGEIQDISISISGVSEAAERVQYSPAVGEDGGYRQKLAPGQYVFNRSTITVLHGDTPFALPLEPVGRLWNKDRGGEEGIEQDFVWKVTGPTPYGRSDGLDPANATHWYGMSIGLRADGWRNDINAAPTPIPAGTKLTFVAKPLSPSIDGRSFEPITVERTFDPAGLSNPDINDLPPADYELSGTATLPDGTTEPILIQGRGDYPGYKPSVRVPLEKDGIIGGMAKHLLSFVIE